MKKHPFTSAIIVAAGSATRMGLDTPKQLLIINGKTVIERTLSVFESCPLIDEIIVAARSADIDDIAAIAFEFRKVTTVTAGGATRMESVSRGVRAADKRATHYAINDGARVLIKPIQIKKVLDAAFEYGAAALGTPLTDTVKVIGDDNTILSTPDRSAMWAVQTPQVFEKTLYKRALENALTDHLSVTDDCAMVEALGEKVHVIQGEYSNIKLTTPVDIAIAEALLAK